MALLERYGVDTVFGIPGAHTLDMYRGIAGSNIRHVLARHEQGAGFMADGYARASGRPGVCTLITGPGVTNAATALGQSFADSIPMLMISSTNATHTLGKGWGCLHEITDQQAVTAPLTAFSATALSPDDLPELIGQAFSRFTSARPRPVHIAVPIDVLAAATDAEWSTRAGPARPRPAREAIVAAAALLARSERPVLYAGGGAVEAAGPLTELAEWLNAAVLSSNAGKGIVPESHALSIGGGISRGPAKDYLGRADVVLAIGTELAETDSFVERLHIAGKLIRIDIDPSKINDLYPADVGIQADAGAAAQELLAALRDSGANQTREQARDDVKAVRAACDAGLSDTERQHQRVLQSVRAALPAQAVVMGDISQLVYTGSYAFPVEQPRSWFYPAGYCTLGCALPNAIGAALAVPDKPVAVLAGDGGFMFTVQELATAVQEGLSIPVVIWNNGALRQIRDDMDEMGIPRIGVDLHNPDFVALAEAFGARGRRPASVDELESALAESLDAGVPTLIDVHQDSSWLI